MEGYVNMMADIAVIGAGSFGCALAVSFSLKHNVTMWTFSEAEKNDILTSRENRSRLPGIKIPESINITTNANEILDSDFVFFAVPSEFLRSTAVALKPYISSSSIIVNTSKGIEESTFKGGYQVLSDEFPLNRIAIMCGPTHAEELARKIPTSFVVASALPDVCLQIKNAISNDFIHLFCSDDAKGIEICSTFKNVIAIGAGICVGLNTGANTIAALITKGLSEISALGLAIGAKPQTFLGLAGLGDLIVTCESEHSRNRQMGKLVGQGIAVKTALAQINMVVEGYNNTKTAHRMAESLNVSLPLINCIYEILFKDRTPSSILAAINTFEDFN